MHRLVAFWVNVRSSLWFIPTVIAATAAVFGYGLAQSGRVFPSLAQSELPQIFGFSAEGSRAMLSAIATSMITVAGVAFSVTIVALSLASSQYSPRVLRQFMRDRGNQYVLGVFVGIFAYCLVVLPLVRGGEEEGYVPALAVAFGVALALGGVGCLIFFIHHVANAIQASSIIAEIAEETHRAIDKLFPDTLGKDAGNQPVEVKNLQWHPVDAPTSGMLQLVNESALLEAAANHDLVIRMEYRIGDFVVKNTPIVSISRAPKKDIRDSVTAAFTINRTRTIEQDAAYGLRQIVDVALRALSPSLNDTTTAILCINYIADLLRHAAARHRESHYRRKDGAVRVIATGAEFSDFVSLGLDQIRESGGGNVVVLDRLLWAIPIIAGGTLSVSRREPLAAAARAIAETADREIKDSAARTELVERAREIGRNCRNQAMHVAAIGP